MSLEQPTNNKMITSAPKQKAGFHFPGDGIWENAYIWAPTIEEATKQWLATRKLISRPQSTPIIEERTNDIN